MSRGSKSGRPRALDRETRELIIQFAIENRTTSRESLADQLDKEIAARGFTPPSIETLKKYISEARSKNENPEDLAWSLGICSKYKEYFPLYAIPIIMGFLKKYEDKLLKPFSIRYAKWIVRLTPIINKLVDPPDPEFTEMMIKSVAWQYTKSERISEVLGDKSFDTTALDKRYFIDFTTKENFIEANIDHMANNWQKEDKGR
jgi:hypothetical protein